VTHLGISYHAQCGPGPQLHNELDRTAVWDGQTDPRDRRPVFCLRGPLSFGSNDFILPFLFFT
jgi:hypothetical protein